MFEKKIIFCATKKEMVDAWPHPQPATRFIPESYKKLERHLDGNLHKATVKTCMPFLDSLTAGYIIPFDQDYIIDPTGDDFEITTSNGSKVDGVDFGFHPKFQLTEEMQKNSGAAAGKFHNKWLIKTPPGYSCLFIKPMNRIETRFEILSGIVDTDKYVHTINFPFTLLKWDEQFRIKRGEPMVQIIPFKRESWKKWSGFYFEKLHNKVNSLISSVAVDKYKSFFWSKKSFK